MTPSMISESIQRIKVSFLSYKIKLPSAGHWYEKHGEQGSEDGPNGETTNEEAFGEWSYHGLTINVNECRITEYGDVNERVAKVECGKAEEREFVDEERDIF